MTEKMTGSEISDLILKGDCSLCKEGQMEVGQVSKYGAAVIAKRGDSAQDGWYATLQSKTPADPTTGFSIMLMPWAHVQSWGEVSQYQELKRNWGELHLEAMAAIEQVMHKGGSELGVGYYAKSGTANNSQAHIHCKAFEVSGGLDQAWPSDNPWFKKDLEGSGAELYVRAKPVIQTALAPERFNELKEFLVGYLNK